MLLETYTYLGKQQEGFKVLRDLAASLSSDRWYSTQRDFVSVGAAWMQKSMLACARCTGTCNC